MPKEIKTLESRTTLDAAIRKAAAGDESAIMVASVLISRQPSLIRRLRKLAGLTQRQLAQRVDTFDHYFSQWENGKHKPTLVFTDRIVRAVAAELAPDRMN